MPEVKVPVPVAMPKFLSAAMVKSIFRAVVPVTVTGPIRATTPAPEGVDALSRVLSDLLHPMLHIVEGFLVRHIVDDDDTWAPR